MQQQFDKFMFDHICQIEPKRDELNQLAIFMPQKLYKDCHLSRLHAYGNGPFCRFRIPNDLRTAGIYILTVDSTPYYVGKCVNLAKRYNMGYGQISPRNCYEKGQSTNCRLNNLIYQAVSGAKQVDLWFLAILANHDEVESALIRQLQTRQYWNNKD